MNKETNITYNACENCEYYKPHYVINRSRLRKTSYGHCAKKREGKPLKICKHFLPIESQDKEDAKIQIKQTLENVSARLSEISKILIYYENLQNKL